MLLEATRADADTFKDAINNTVPLSVSSDGQILDRGVGLLLGTYKGKALLLAPAHVLSDLREIGKEGAPYVLEVALADSAFLRISYSNLALYVKNSSLKDAMLNDYAIVEAPVTMDKRGVISNLTPAHFARPTKNSSVFVYGYTANGGWHSTNGELVGRSGDKVVSFEIKTGLVIEKGESGSLVIDNDNRVLGILISTDGKNARGVFPGPILEAALNTIAWSEDNRRDFQGFAVSILRNFQYSSTTEDLGGGTIHTSTDSGLYTSIDFEYFRIKKASGFSSNRKNGFVVGYSGGSAHGLGQVENADYTLKYGLVFGELDRFNDNMGQMEIFVLSHRLNGSYVHRLGLSFEAATQLSAQRETALDLGFRIELNDLGATSARTGHASMGVGVLLRYSWLHAM